MSRKFLKRSLIAALSAGALLMTPVMTDAVWAQPMTSESDFVAANPIRDGVYDLTFDDSIGIEYSRNCNGQVVDYIAYENIVYVAKPKDAAYQSMNIYIPKGYLEGKTINGYTAKTAPIFMPNSVGGYMPGKALTPIENDRMSGSANAVLFALSRGYVVACPAIRGRTNVVNGVYVGKAPALIVDYKAAVRYLRFNRDMLPAGDPEMIISNGTSAGGALSALLGVTGNAEEYEPYLNEIGAARGADNIFASSDYCPITNLENADMAYEWLFNGINIYHQNHMQMPVNDTQVMNRPDNAPTESASAAEMTEAEIAVSKVLKDAFPIYLNSLDLLDKNNNQLVLDDKGNGSFKDYIKSKLIESAQSAIDEGIDISNVEWVIINNGRVVDVDLDIYAFAIKRLKAAPAFDKLDLTSGENDEFATNTNEPRHFTPISKQYETVQGAMADESVIGLMNPMNFIGGNATYAPYFRIRHGALDRDTSLAIPAILALKLENQGVYVDFFVPWNRGHAGDYDLVELFDWMDKICKADPHNY
ncbi:MAG: alpha/beta hydrolase [Selenomonadaceae bacterium]|nr:alpha/beta hydrolase [Selenomonadaceae bacterium]